jgi:hypothetical protein
MLWHQVPFAVLAGAGLVVALVRRRRDPWLAGFAVYAAAVAAAFSLFAYKTPWHAVHFVPGFALLAAACLLSGCQSTPAAATSALTTPEMGLSSSMLGLFCLYSRPLLPVYQVSFAYTLTHLPCLQNIFLMSTILLATNIALIESSILLGTPYSRSLLPI